MIKWEPNKEARIRVWNYKLAMVVTKNAERVLIGTEVDIKRQLEGKEDANLVYDETRPFGTLLFSLDTDPKGGWATAVYMLMEAQKLMHTPAVSRIASKSTAPDFEKIALDILSEKCDSEDPICQFVAMRIWYGYWIHRGKKSPYDCAQFLQSMQNLIRPFSSHHNYAEEMIHVTSNNSIFHHTKELEPCDRQLVLYHIQNEVDQDCVLVDESLIPLEKYYLSKFDKWKKYIVRCKICSRLFMADTLRYELCSDECRNQARLNNLALRKQDEDISEIDRICMNASAHWYNRLTKIKNSVEYSQEDIAQYSSKKEHFLKEKRKKRQAYKKGRISYTQLQNWLLQQEAEAQIALETIWLHKGDSNPKNE